MAERAVLSILTAGGPAEARHCACGSTFEVGSDSEAAVAELLGIWQMCHADAPHRPVTASEAAEIRRRQLARGVSLDSADGGDAA
jgi:hypothetical protein